ncbi:hypothetical protein L7F22_026934 [Adiantum nelumboides]|nr:hypothetical protein [Adiantum nelumboides]
MVVEMADLETDDALVMQSFLDAFMSEQSSEHVMQESMLDRHVEWSCSRDAQRCESSTRQMTVTDDSVIHAFLDMLDREHVDVSSLDGQEMHVADTPCQSEMPIARDIYVDACSVELARQCKTTKADSGLWRTVEEEAQAQGKATMRWNVPALGDDVMDNILLRLPLSTCLRLACVCKAWYSAFSSPSLPPLSTPQPLFFALGLHDVGNEVSSYIYDSLSGRWFALPPPSRPLALIVQRYDFFIAATSCLGPLILHPYTGSSKRCSTEPRGLEIHSGFGCSKHIRQGPHTGGCRFGSSRVLDNVQAIFRRKPSKGELLSRGVIRTSTCGHFRTDEFVVLAVLETGTNPTESVKLYIQCIGKSVRTFIVYELQTDKWELLKPCPFVLPPHEGCDWERYNSSTVYKSKIFVWHQGSRQIAYFDTECKVWSDAMSLNNIPDQKLFLACTDRGLHVILVLTDELKMYRLDEVTLQCTNVGQVDMSPISRNSFACIHNLVYIYDHTIGSTVLVFPGEDFEYHEFPPWPVTSSGNMRRVRLCPLEARPKIFLRLIKFQEVPTEEHVLSKPTIKRKHHSGNLVCLLIQSYCHSTFLSHVKGVFKR